MKMFSVVCKVSSKLLTLAGTKHLTLDPLKQPEAPLCPNVEELQVVSVSVRNANDANVMCDKLR